MYITIFIPKMNWTKINSNLILTTHDSTNCYEGHQNKKVYIISTTILVH